MISRLALIAISLMGLSTPCYGSQQQSSQHHPRTIHFHTHSIDTRHMTHVLHQQYENMYEKQGFLIQLEPEHIHDIKHQIEQHLGYSLTHYYPSNTWLTYTTPHTVHTLASSIPGIAWIGSYEPSYKYHSSITSSEWDAITSEVDMDPISQYFFNETETSQVNNDKQQYSINVHLQQEDSDDSDPAIQSSLVTLAQDWMRLASISGNVEIHGYDMITIHLKNEASIRPLSQHIAKHARVHYIERSYPNQLNNKWAKSISMWNLPAPPATMTATAATTALTGANEVVGIIDTGVDPNSCFFFDPNTPVTITPFVRTATPAAPTAAAAAHRKIIQYINFAGDAMDDNGHGTHVAGTIAGSSLAAGFAPFNGMATAAKLAVFDAGRDNEFVVPRPLDQFMLPYATAAGAAIHVNAWGSFNPAYDSTAQEFDKYMWAHPEFLAIVAAGNNANGNGNGGITSPATSKNALVVGATVSSQQSYLGIFCPPSATNVDGGIYPNNKLCAQAQTITPNSVTAWSSRGPTLDGRIKPDVVATGMFLVSAKNNQQQGQSCTNAPNKVLKARAGTSMSAGVVAGDVAAIRQYFRGGYYPSGTPVNAAIQPSAALLKAIVIDGAIPATQIPGQALPTVKDAGFGRMVVSNGIPLWGANFNLIMKRDTNNALGDPVFTAATATQTQTFTICAQPITTANPSRLTVTLVWTDAPGTVNAQNVLVNNLDLQVVYGTTTLLGNGGANPDFKNNVEQVIVSTLATATTMTIKIVPNTITTFNVNGTQPYALIVTGNVLAGTCTTTPTTTTTTGQPTTATTTTEFFTWITSAFSVCSAPCMDPVNFPNGGMQTRNVTCQSSIKGVVADSFCIAQVATLGPKPVSVQACNTVSCGLIKYQWTMGTFTTCSLPCADANNTMGGVQTRTVTCQSIATNVTTSVVVAPTFCGDHVMPVTIQACNTLPCPAAGAPTTTMTNGNVDGLLFEWRVSAPSICSANCNGGIALRQVTCFIGEIAVDATFCAALPMPASQVPCNTQACSPGQSPTNTTTSAPTPTPTVPATATNTTLTNPDGMNGGMPTSPPLTGNLPAPIAQSFTWQVFDYGPCSVGCADPVNSPQGGTQTRVVKCRSSLNNFDDDARCAPVPKPPTSKSCNMDACPRADDFNLEWVTGIYGICDPDTQTQTRWVVCKTTDNQYVDFAQCQAHVGPIPATTQPCIPPANIQDALNTWQTTFATPVWSWQAQRFGDCSQWCNGPGNQTRGLHCLAPMGLVATTFDQCRNDPKAGVQPITIQSCGALPCASTPQWYGGDFIGCTDPDPCLGTEQRHVFCIDTNGHKLADTALCTAPQIPFTRSPCGACVPKAKTILGLAPAAVIGIAAGVGVLALIGVAYLALQWRRRVRDQNNKVASRIALSKV